MILSVDTIIQLIRDELGIAREAIDSKLDDETVIYFRGVEGVCKELLRQIEGNNERP